MAIHIDHDQVSIEQLGSNASFLNRTPLTSNEKHLVNDGDLLHLLENEHGYTIRIERLMAEDGRSTIASPIKATLKRQNTDDEPLSPKKQKTAEKSNETSDGSQTDEPAEENRLAWIQEQLNALQAHAQPPYDISLLYSSPISPSF